MKKTTLVSLLIAFLSATPAIAADNADRTIAAGTMIAMRLLHGVDMGINLEARQYPRPMLFAVTTEGLADMRCTVLMSGYGELPRERITARGEWLTCFDTLGNPTTASIDGYLVGDDNKDGQRGKLVSKTAQHGPGAAILEVESGRAATFVVLKNVSLKATPVSSDKPTTVAMAASPGSNEALGNPGVQQAILTTQLLAARICQDKANLDPQALAKHSTAFTFVLALQALGATDAFATKPGLLPERMEHMMCGQGGILQFEPHDS